jgi:hypothetical protein
MQIYRESFSIEEILLKYQSVLARSEKLAATLIGIKLALEQQGGYEATIAQINSVLAE